MYYTILTGQVILKDGSFGRYFKMVQDLTMYLFLKKNNIYIFLKNDPISKYYYDSG